MKRATFFLLAILLALGGVTTQRQVSAQPAVPVTGADAVRSIELPQMTPDMPEGPGRNSFLGSCVICHSPRYVMMQPQFPRKTWEAQVEKMRKVYGAPVPDAAVPEIVNYLVAVRGKPEEATQPSK